VIGTIDELAGTLTGDRKLFHAKARGGAYSTKAAAAVGFRSCAVAGGPDWQHYFLEASTVRGSRIVKVDPRPGSLSTVMSPPII
jgi:hypothetical protein